MIGIALNFTAGRFHATPWGRHVNEGAPEWPPSPWRLLRSLVAVWKHKLGDRISEVETKELLQHLSDTPQFRLPAASTGHARHYMPWFKKGPGDRTKVFDAFVALPRDADVTMLWTGKELSADQRSALSLLLENLGWFGRAESWCSATLLDHDAVAKIEPNCVPMNGEPGDRELEPVRVLCADPAFVFDNEHTPKLVLTEGRGKNKQTIQTPLYDPDWHLCMETAALHEQRWSDPPGSRWVTYGRSPDCFRVTYASRPKSAIKKSRFQIARYAIDSAVLPLLQETLPVAEQARRGLRLHTETFFGKDAGGRPLTGHRHAYYLPTDEDGDGRLDHLTIVSETPFTEQEIRSLDRLQLRRRPGQEPPSAPIQLLLLGLASFDDLDYKPLPLRASARWVSATPFLATRHPKRRGQKRDAQELLLSPASFLEAVLREEVARFASRRGNQSQRSVAAIKTICPLMDHNAFRIRPRDWRQDAGDRTLRALQFKRFRQKRGDDGGRRLAGAFEIRFEEPVRGPICFGHSSHFGLGLFLPAADGGE